jgi:tRNA A-37 threonylcarbamoyl transferase component Bud32
MPRFLAAQPNTQLITLPWGTPLAHWPAENLVALPRGLSRHVVRFVRVGTEVYALKEVVEHIARREYRLLRDLTRLDTPSVEPIGVVTERVQSDGEPLDSILITRHLQFSLPYRSLFSRGVRQDTVNRLVDAMVVLLARLHLIGFLWGDVSLSNTLFRRDAGAFAAYLVDAETGELHDQLTDGQREHDLTIARTNLYGEFCDLEAGGLLDEALDPLVLVETIESRYRELWGELTGVEEFNAGEMHRIESRARRLNALGFDVAELDITTDFDGSTIRIQPKVVDAGHHQRRLIRLTGMDTEENQARRLLNDLDYYRARTDQQGADEAIVAHEWLTEQFELTLQAVPMELRGKLEPAELYHEMLEHRWFMSEKAGAEVSMEEAAQSYVNTVLRGLPDEKVAVAALEPTGLLANPYDSSQAVVDDDEEKPYDPWEDEGESEAGESEAGEPAAAGYLDIAALRAKANK